MRWKTDLRERAYEFGVTALDLYPRLAKLGRQFEHMAFQYFKAATSIGAQLQESDVAASRRDMGLKQAVGLREARESRHWLRLLIHGNAMVETLTPLLHENSELVAMLTASVKKLRARENVGEAEPRS